MIRLTPALTAAQIAYLKAFSRSRRVMRDEEGEKDHPDPLRKRVRLPVGKDGAFVVHDDTSRRLVTDPNNGPAGQPGVWCFWRASSDGRELVWQSDSDSEDAYGAGAWLKWIAENIFARWRVLANGTMFYRTTEESGVVAVRDNDVREPSVEHTYVDPWSGELVVIEELNDDDDDVEDDDDEDDDDDDYDDDEADD